MGNEMLFFWDCREGRVGSEVAKGASLEVGREVVAAASLVFLCL